MISDKGWALSSPSRSPPRHSILQAGNLPWSKYECPSQLQHLNPAAALEFPHPFGDLQSPCPSTVSRPLLAHYTAIQTLNSGYYFILTSNWFLPLNRDWVCFSIIIFLASGIKCLKRAKTGLTVGHSVHPCPLKLSSPYEKNLCTPSRAIPIMPSHCWKRFGDPHSSWAEGLALPTCKLSNLQGECCWIWSPPVLRTPVQQRAASHPSLGASAKKRLLLPPEGPYFLLQWSHLDNF